MTLFNFLKKNDILQKKRPTQSLISLQNSLTYLNLSK